MTRYELERESTVYAIRDTFSGDLVEHAVLGVPESFRSEKRARRRLAELEEMRRGSEGIVGLGPEISSGPASLPYP